MRRSAIALMAPVLWAPIARTMGSLCARAATMASTWAARSATTLPPVVDRLRQSGAAKSGAHVPMAFPRLVQSVQVTGRKRV